MAIRPFRFLKRVLALVVGQNDELLSLTRRIDELGNALQRELREVRQTVCGDELDPTILDRVNALDVKLDDVLARLDQLAATNAPPADPSPGRTVS